MALIVLALDALDPVHVELSETDTFLLNTAGECETFAHMYDKPHTSEVWPTVATGRHPSEHGVTEGNTSRWDNPLIDFASRFTGRLSGKTRTKLGNLVQRITGADWKLREVDGPTIFDGPGRVVHNWPGVHRGEELQRAWDIFTTANQSDEDMTKAEFDRLIRGLAAEQFGWVREMLNHNLSLIATHIHVIDATGHVYQYDQESYYSTYRWTERHVKDILSMMHAEDELLILSDHGIETGWVSEHPDEGAHSWRAFSSSTLESRPQSVFDVYQWVQANLPDNDDYRRSENGTVDLPEDQLEDLGYI